MRQLILGLLLLVWSQSASAFFFDRRPVRPSTMSYFIFPVYISIPGIGTGVGVGAAATRIKDSEVDAIVGHTEGDFTGDLLLITDLPLFSPKLTFSPIYLRTQGAGIERWARGPDSKPDEKFVLRSNRILVYGGELSLHLFEDQLELYRIDTQIYAEPTAIIDPQGNEYTSRLSNKLGSHAAITGIYLDDTDNRRDPRIGYRAQVEHWTVKQNEPALGDGYQWDYHLSGFVPLVPKEQILVLYGFYSEAGITRPGVVDPAKYQCEEALYPGCQVLNDQLYRQRQEDVHRGNATALGGTQRLRAFPQQRFYDSHSLFLGLEHRWYLAEDWVPFDWIWAKGIFNAWQLAFFYELGQVSPYRDQSLLENLKASRGVGLRALLSDLVLRVDVAFGEEGQQVIAWVGYPF